MSLGFHTYSLGQCKKVSLHFLCYDMFHNRSYERKQDMYKLNLSNICVVSQGIFKKTVEVLQIILQLHSILRFVNHLKVSSLPLLPPTGWCGGQNGLNGPWKRKGHHNPICSNFLSMEGALYKYNRYSWACWFYNRGKGRVVSNFFLKSLPRG